MRCACDLDQDHNRTVTLLLPCRGTNMDPHPPMVAIFQGQDSVSYHTDKLLCIPYRQVSLHQIQILVCHTVQFDTYIKKNSSNVCGVVRLHMYT